MEFASFLAGERWSDHPACTHALLATLARNVNDQMSDAGRQKLLGLVPSVVGLTSDDPLVDVHLALLCATTALPVVAADTQRVLAVGILSAERQLALLEGRDDGVLTDASLAALADVPQAASWARDFSAAIEPSDAGFYTSGAPSIVCCSILGVAVACTRDRDERLLDLLVRGIGVVQAAAAAARVAAPTAPVAEPDRYLQTEQVNPLRRTFQSSRFDHS
ncbi:hypothetical protein [Pengzhenrongella frigida]|uniref:hypothetical protein n=1 Tax=Pengzhenrongella frigida TaxID=1259133 RepID=UPI001A92FAB0|nr:hypothetical protein [Cellulomonas sp. HLT2-17]